MPSLKLSHTGLQIIRQAREQKGWTIYDPRWLEAASKIIAPEQDWENSDFFASGVSLPTWKRFLSGGAINAPVFKVFCQVLNCHWEDLIDPPAPKPDIKEIPDIPLFFGRRYELEILGAAIEQKKPLIVITGIGGMGKTALAVKLAENCRGHFQQTLWFSFHHHPPTRDALPTLAPHTLLIFDGWDCILGGNRGGQYRAEYELYADFLRSVVQTSHHSCVIITSREQPEGLTLLTAAGAVIFPLGGLMEGAVELLQYHQLSFDAQHWVALLNQYGGNPLFLNMVANFIHELFAGDVGQFLASGTLVAGEFAPLVTQWLKYISIWEKMIMELLATKVQGFTRQEILLRLTSHASNGDISAALLCLKRRALIETMKDGDMERFYLQPVILKSVQRLFG
ncbi:ATP-binding protein [Umezakia ovalisporum]|uniref:ATP-binding protein n=1 Tax=Umezakia ovalisporum TaxID=75695 RepID=UPI002474B466|nr:ATP-binding protein [Umezakia ovalisporum]MDH6086553.1 ATP-binding protein [Umezakia ovalisporum TAC611]